MIGDGLMAVFGAPLALDNHEERAVRAAIEMTELVTLFNAERERDSKPPIRIGIGIASGGMIAGYTGTKARATYTCVGDTVNLAARIEAHTKAARRAIVIDRATRDMLRERIATEALGAVTFKGFSEATEVFAVAAD